LICATTASVCNSRKNVSIKVVLPAPDFAGYHHETVG